MKIKKKFINTLLLNNNQAFIFNIFNQNVKFLKKY